MKQKMWIRLDRSDMDGWWEVGCQCCGRVITHDSKWSYALDWALGHAEAHRD